MAESEILAQVSVVNQSAFLFNASLYENITMFGHTPAPDSDAYQSSAGGTQPDGSGEARG